MPGELNLAGFDDHPDATERQVRALSTLKISRPVGSKCEYSNLNYNILGLIVEAADSLINSSEKVNQGLLSSIFVYSISIKSRNLMSKSL